MSNAADERRKRKEEGRRRKRQRIQESGGVRPRKDQQATDEAATRKKNQAQATPPTVITEVSGTAPATKDAADGTTEAESTTTIPESRGAGSSGKPKSSSKTTNKTTSTAESREDSSHGKTVSFTKSTNNSNKKDNGWRQLGSSNKPNTGGGGGYRVMASPPSRNRARTSTLSIALPGSIVANCQTRELRTQLVGQIARAATIYHVDEIVVYDDKLAAQASSRRNRDYRRAENDNTVDPDSKKQTPYDPHAFFARVLQYCETPQYLRRHFFPMHPDLQFAGLLAPIDAPHHVRSDDAAKYREGVVLDKPAPKPNHALVNCGIFQRPVLVPTPLQPGIRCTVQIDAAEYQKPKGGKEPHILGQIVSPSAPREDNGTYWGYTTRTADSIKTALDQCPFEGGQYDMKIGTSERGTLDLDHPNFDLAKAAAAAKKANASKAAAATDDDNDFTFRHVMIVFGGVAGIEECVDADESLRLPRSLSHRLFDLWINVCQYQGSRTIRTEEAVLITLSKLGPTLMRLEQEHTAVRQQKQRQAELEAQQADKAADMATAAKQQLADDGPMSEESSDEDEA